ncbi:MAG: hypothetical protein IMY72_05175 [Bacteroidetes bacterium]|nr:hypothetical protein [Bacteroidota bacterium]
MIINNLNITSKKVQYSSSLRGQSLKQSVDNQYIRIASLSLAMTSRILLFILISFSFVLTSKAQKHDFGGQVIGWSTFNFNKPVLSQGGIRYIPDYKYKKKYKNHLVLKSNISINAYGTGLLTGLDSINTDYDIKPYRLQVGLSGEQFDLRIGLQKINFGSASMLRPLMWFDKIDPRDPLQLTDGVYGLLGRYYFLNNANIWLWSLFGNEKTKGWEIFQSNWKIPEIGGRIQYPLLTGELAATYHHRKGIFSDSFADTLSSRDGFSENRFALDGKFDYEIGFWFETVLIHQNLDFTNQCYQRIINIGADYTFGLGNGLSVKTEFFAYQQTNKVFNKGRGINFSAISITYPLNIINNIQAIVYYDVTNNDIYRFVNFSWTYDDWMFYVMGFWNPDNFQIYQNVRETRMFGGYGAQIMLVFNY